MDGQPRYVWLANTLRQPILSGELSPGSRLPSRAQLARDHGVSEQVSRRALRLLINEGIVESRPGAGYYVRQVPERIRFPRTDHSSRAFLGTLHQQPVDTITEPAGGDIAERLGIREEEALYRTRRIGERDGFPVVAHVSWEPTVLTYNTTRSPCESDPDLSVVDRLGAAGIRIDRVIEEVTVRPLSGAEAELLNRMPGDPAIVMERTHYNGERAVETSDLLGATDQCRLVYRLSMVRTQRR
ncbi:GntR family transcriptional regulator [Salinactinospora qingdaonensis]|uniref:GntR family transcriptional regulator n=1 Tax=Salinactinospora qingdaonensis TaxID=702744 RepID=A0ABP7FWH7_9ACTN